jgi:hypothetical protein
MAAITHWAAGGSELAVPVDSRQHAPKNDSLGKFQIFCGVKVTVRIIHNW